MKLTTYYLISVTIIFGACGTSSKIEKSWRDPDVAVDMSGLNKVLVVALLKDETNRRATEDELVSMLNGKGVASYNYLTKDVKQENEIKERLKADGFDGAVVMRLADVEKDVNYVSGSFNTYPVYYRSFWGFYRRTWDTNYQPGYYQTTKTYTVETNVYSFLRDKLVWSGITTSANPADVNKLMNSSAKVIYKQMKKEGFITGK